MIPGCRPMSSAYYKSTILKSCSLRHEVKPDDQDCSLCSSGVKNILHTSPREAVAAEETRIPKVRSGPIPSPSAAGFPDPRIQPASNSVIQTCAWPRIPPTTSTTSEEGLRNYSRQLASVRAQPSIQRKKAKIISPPLIFKRSLSTGT